MTLRRKAETGLSRKQNHVSQSAAPCRKGTGELVSGLATAASWTPVPGGEAAPWFPSRRQVQHRQLHPCSCLPSLSQTDSVRDVNEEEVGHRRDSHRSDLISPSACPQAQPIPPCGQAPATSLAFACISFPGQGFEVCTRDPSPRHSKLLLGVQ